MSNVTKAQIRDNATARIVAITIPAATASIPYTHPEWRFLEYAKTGGSIRFVKTLQNSRTFQVEIGSSRRVGLESLVAVEKITTFRVIVLYKGGNAQEMEDVIGLDTRLIANALREDVSGEVSLYPATDVEEEPQRIEVGGQLVYVHTTEWRGQHSELEWGAA